MKHTVVYQVQIGLWRNHVRQHVSTRQDTDPGGRSTPPAIHLTKTMQKINLTRPDNEHFVMDFTAGEAMIGE